MNFKPTGINHLTYRVNRIELSKDFYGRILGFQLIREMGESMAVYRIGDRDTLVIVEAETSYDPNSRDFRVDHIGFSLHSADEVDEMAGYLSEQAVTILSGPANRKNGRFVFFSDPDGNLIEFFWEKESF